MLFYGEKIFVDTCIGFPDFSGDVFQFRTRQIRNLFQGIVKLKGKAVPYAEVEVEYYNEKADGALQAPTDYMITQTVKADGNGVFSYAVPGPGWWGFAALNTADYTIAQDGVEKDVELGAVLWVKFHPFR